jgi:hypothetical protein
MAAGGGKGLMNSVFTYRTKCAHNRLSEAMVPIALLAMSVLPGLGQNPAQPAFPSAAEAAEGLFQAVQHDNLQEIASILGGPAELASSSDEAQDKLDRQMFVEKYRQMHRVGRDADGTEVLYIGAENWPFPIPLASANGKWRFDPAGGTKEVLYRRIGENELRAIDVCREFVAAKKPGAASSSVVPHEPGLPEGLLANAPGASPVLFHGYYFRLLSAGASLIAYPAEYRSSGVVTFVVTDRGVVYEKDLGAQTSSLGGGIQTFHKDSTWRTSGD